MDGDQLVHVQKWDGKETTHVREIKDGNMVMVRLFTVQKKTQHYIYAFSRRFYPKRLTVHSGYTFCLSVCPYALALHCSYSGI